LGVIVHTHMDGIGYTASYSTCRPLLLLYFFFRAPPDKLMLARYAGRTYRVSGGERRWEMRDEGEWDDDAQGCNEAGGESLVRK